MDTNITFHIPKQSLIDIINLHGTEIERLSEITKRIGDSCRELIKAKNESVKPSITKTNDCLIINWLENNGKTPITVRFFPDGFGEIFENTMPSQLNTKENMSFGRVFSTKLNFEQFEKMIDAKTQETIGEVAKASQKRINRQIKVMVATILVISLFVGSLFFSK
jgi:hypothetical protein